MAVSQVGLVWWCFRSQQQKHKNRERQRQRDSELFEIKVFINFTITFILDCWSFSGLTPARDGYSFRHSPHCNSASMVSQIQCSLSLRVQLRCLGHSPHCNYGWVVFHSSHCNYGWVVFQTVPTVIMGGWCFRQSTVTMGGWCFRQSTVTMGGWCFRQSTVTMGGGGVSDKPL